MHSRTTRRQLLQRFAGVSTVAAALRGAAWAAPKEVANMSFSRYEIYPVSVLAAERIREPWMRSFFLQGRRQTHYSAAMIRLFTDEGLVGVADASLGGVGALNLDRSKAVLDSMIGKSPWDYLLSDSIGGVLVAVYDIIGQGSGLPVSRLFSERPGKLCTRAYWSQCYPPDVMASEAKRAFDAGFRVNKVKARPWEDPVEQAAAITSAVPTDYRVWPDANAWWGSVGRTIHIAEKLGEFPHYFAIESPFKRVYLDGYRELKGKVPMRVAEHFPADPMPFIREGLLQALVYQKPQLGRAFLRDALMAEVTGIPLWVNHSTWPGVNHVFQAHQAAALPGVEFSVSLLDSLEDDLMAEEMPMKDGYYTVPDGPGLGVTLDDDALGKYRV